MNKKNIVKLVLGTMIIVSITILGWRYAYLAVYPAQNVEQVRPTDVQQRNIAVVGNEAASFTSEELAMYNGMNGAPAYVAVDGIVYDMTEYATWENGQHMGLLAGRDLTAEFYSSPHSLALLNEMPVVGTLDSVNQFDTLDTLDNQTILMQPDAISQASADTGGASSSGSSGISTGTNAVSSQSDWTLEKLALYDGKNGRPAYIAVNGVIYDVTNIGAWSNGSHQGYQAGRDLTAAFANSPHSLSILSGAPVVGRLSSSASVSLTQPSQQNNSYYDDDDDDEYEHEYEHEDDD